jgi:hypothetical protein
MSKNILAKTIKKEIATLNWNIDMKIIKGLPYKQDARRHKFLIAQLQYLTRSTSSSWLERTAGLVTSFML